MASGSNNYVAPSSNGQYVAMVNGVPHYYDSQAAAEQGFNSLTQTAAPTAAAAPAGDATPQYTNVPLEQLQAQQAQFAAQMAYNQARLQMIDLPMLQLSKDQAAMQAAIDAANAVMQGVNAQSAVQNALINAGNFDMSRGQFAMGIGSQGLQEEGQRQQNLQSAANSASQEAFNALNLSAQLRGPSNAFQQQAVDEGMNNLGVSNGIGAIAGQYSQPLFQGPQATPEAASLATLARDMIEAGGQNGQLTPTQQAYNSALNTEGAPSWTQLAGSYLAPLTNDANSIWSQAANVVGTGKMIDPSLQAALDAAGQSYNFAYPGGAGGGSAALNQAAGAGSYQSPTMPAQQSPTQFGFSGSPGTVGTGTTSLPPPSGSSTPSGSGASSLQGTALQAPGFGTPTGGQTAPNYNTGAPIYGPGFDGSLGPDYGNMSAPTGTGTSGGYSRSGGLFPGASFMQAMPRMGPGYYAPGGLGYQASLAALPNPNQINMRNWLKLNPDTQNFIMSGYNAKGYSNNDILGTLQNEQLPYQAPTFGRIY